MVGLESKDNWSIRAAISRKLITSSLANWSLISTQPSIRGAHSNILATAFR